MFRRMTKIEHLSSVSKIIIVIVNHKTILLTSMTEYLRHQSLTVGQSLKK